MNIDELEKLAMAADFAKGKTLTHFLSDNQKFKEAANPAAILELIRINRELVNEINNLLMVNVTTDDSYNRAVKALARANGESNE